MFFIMVVCTYTEDWKSDQYRWYQNGTKKLPGGGPVVKKVHYICVTPHGKDKSFKRLAYSLLDNTNNLTLVHYLGRGVASQKVMEGQACPHKNHS